MMKLSQRKIFLVSVAVLACLVLGAASLRNQDGENSGVYSVLLRPAIDRVGTEIVLVDAEGKTSALFTTTNVYAEHYHPTEYVRGKIYVLKRPFADSALVELWGYDHDGKGHIIMSAPGIDFRASLAREVIAVFSGNTGVELITFISDDGAVLKKISPTELTGLEPDAVLSPNKWLGDTLWVAALQGRSLRGLYAMSAVDFAVSHHEVSALGIVGHEYAISENGLLAYSDHVAPLEIPSDVPVVATTSLYTFDLVTGAKILLVTLPGSHALEPTWIDKTTVEYNRTAQGERVRVTIP